MCYLSSRIFNNEIYTDYTIAQIYNYFYESFLIDLVNDLLIIMKNNNIDVFNCINKKIIIIINYIRLNRIINLFHLNFFLKYIAHLI